MARKFRGRRLLWAILALALLSGCNTEQPIDSRAMIFGLAFDAAPHGETLVTAERVNPLSSVNSTVSGPGVSGGPPEIFFQGASRTLSGALAQMINTSPGNLDLSNLSIVVVSKTYAQHRGLSIPLQLLRQGGQTRPAAYLFISQGPAKSVLYSEPTTDSGSTFRQLYLAEEGNAPDHPQILSTLLWKALRSTFEPQEGLAVPLIRQFEKKIAFDGAALFRGDIMTGTLSPKDAALYDTIRMREPGLTLTLSSPHGAIVARVTSVHPHITILPGPRVRIRVKAVMAVIENPQWRLPSAQELQHLSQEAAQQLDQLTSRSYRLMTHDKNDALGVGIVVRDTKPSLWTHVRKDWPVPLQQWPYDVQTQVTVMESY